MGHDIAIIGMGYHMAWKKASQELIELVVSRMEPFEAQKKSMFGSTVYFANGQMFTGVHEDHIFLRLSETDREDIKASFSDAAQFEPMKGRPMKEYMIVPPKLYEDEALFRQWVERSMGYVKSLPPKASKPKKK